MFFHLAVYSVTKKGKRQGNVLELGAHLTLIASF
jgi:hypothetical protein